MPTTLALNFAFSPPSRRAPLRGHTWAESHTCEREHVLIRSPVPAGEAALGSDAKRLGLTNLTTGLAVRGRGELRRRLRGRRDTLPRAQSEATSQTPLLPPDDEHRMHSVRQRTGGRTEGPGSPGSPPGPPRELGGTLWGEGDGGAAVQVPVTSTGWREPYLRRWPTCRMAPVRSKRRCPDSRPPARRPAGWRVGGRSRQGPRPPPGAPSACSLPGFPRRTLRACALGSAGRDHFGPSQLGGGCRERAGLPGELSGTQGPPGRRGW